MTESGHSTFWSSTTENILYENESKANVCLVVKSQEVVYDKSWHYVSTAQ